MMEPFARHAAGDEDEINLLFEKASRAAAEMPAEKSVYQFW
jgi:hypothetical protein